MYPYCELFTEASAPTLEPYLDAPAANRADSVCPLYPYCDLFTEASAPTLEPYLDAPAANRADSVCPLYPYCELFTEASATEPYLDASALAFELRT